MNLKQAVEALAPDVTAGQSKTSTAGRLPAAAGRYKAVRLWRHHHKRHNRRFPHRLQTSGRPKTPPPPQRSPSGAVAENAQHGVIHGIPLSDTSQQINANIVNTRNLLALAAKRIGTTTTIVIAFSGPDVPYLVRYGATLIPCSLYRKQIEICYQCGRLGHRMNVCPFPNNKICRGCGLSQEVRNLKQFKTPAPTPPAEASPSSSHDAPMTPAPKKRALQEGAAG
ncbi:hypothetical protein HPB49_016632 [Dermacentor silvarum]|uniref:Uncharacterized protein n=1 Tax=Dermacentor silvarum TaxID=543639 RepID=A0ACB8DJQ6_DERSI|nr:hypothetical protein HPB49_016632 [Dermacentor silvarum]